MLRSLFAIAKWNAAKIVASSASDDNETMSFKAGD